YGGLVLPISNSLLYSVRCPSNRGNFSFILKLACANTGSPPWRGSAWKPIPVFPPPMVQERLVLDRAHILRMAFTVKENEMERRAQSV
ncbi:hypothetical protein, partial [Paracidovorax avenae]|uniref:hypothetical protein n=1 Tax=Paracidovorax avenae TaxID=80867 RepID=UPI001CEF9867